MPSAAIASVTRMRPSGAVLKIRDQRSTISDYELEYAVIRLLLIIQGLNVVIAYCYKGDPLDKQNRKSLVDQRFHHNIFPRINQTSAISLGLASYGIIKILNRALNNRDQRSKTTFTHLCPLLSPNHVHVFRSKR